MEKSLWLANIDAILKYAFKVKYAITVSVYDLTYDYIETKIECFDLLLEWSVIIFDPFIPQSAADRTLLQNYQRVSAIDS
jgi:uncharacterized membrane protein